MYYKYRYLLWMLDIFLKEICKDSKFGCLCLIQYIFNAEWLELDILYRNLLIEEYFVFTTCCIV